MLTGGCFLLSSSGVFRDAFDTVIQTLKIQALSMWFCPLHHTDITLQAVGETRDYAFNPRLCMHCEWLAFEGPLTRRRTQAGEIISALAMRRLPEVVTFLVEKVKRWP